MRHVVEKPGDECNEWTGGHGGHDSRAVCRLGAVTMNAARAFWILTEGPIPDGLKVLHHCDNGDCTKRSHLYLGTDADNARDRESRNRSNYESRNWKPPKRSLSEEDIREMRRLFDSGEMTIAAIARKYGMSSRGYVSMIVHRKRLVDIE